MSSASPLAPGLLAGDELLTSAMISDSLDAAGLRSQVLRERLAPVVPGSRAFGRATTARFLPSTDDNPDDPYGAAIDYISGVTPGQFIVIATDESNDSAFWGELFSAAAIGAGSVGVLTDGNLRDTARIAGLGFPAFSRSRRPIDFRMRLAISETATTVTIGGVEIAQGDLVIADDDGVVVIPQAREGEVLALARERASRESTVLAELLGGQTLRAVWDRHRVL
ncbi:MAG: RraA family protein [Glaciihabitans sp.]|jgi:4-hydroxy-4-methyl-2-oxoglutarate aldolase|nr:RraA family protein [Glaciihabitans sp.]